jgi:TPR repeat protein
MATAQSASAAGLVGTWQDDHGAPFLFNGHTTVEIPNSREIDLPNGSPWTLEAWVFPQGNGAMHIAGKRGVCAGGDGFYQIAIDRNAAGKGMGIDPSDAPNNTWTHVAITSDGVSGWVVYANGVAVKSVRQSGWKIRNQAPFRIGGSGTCAAFVGAIRRVSLYRRALTPQELRSEYETHRADLAKITVSSGPSGAATTADTGKAQTGQQPGQSASLGSIEPPGDALPNASCGAPLKRSPLDPWDPRFTPAPEPAFAREIGRADELFREKKYGDAGRLYQRAALAKDAYASRRLGVIFLFGLAGLDASYATNPAAAIQLFRQAAEKGDAVSTRMLGWMVARGIGTTKDFGVAKSLFELAAKNGYPEAEISMGLLYARGDGLEPSYSEAMRWFKLAISHNDPNGLVAVASLHEDGLGVEQSEAEAMRLYRRAADEGSALGAQNVARLYEQGIGVPKVISTALCWYGKAAVAGDADSMNRLGLWLDQQHRYPEALAWFLRGADAGNTDAMYNVGRYRTNGIAGPKTTDAESGDWFWRAKNLGNAQAARVVQARRQAVAQMLSIAYAIITAPPPPPRCYKYYGPYQTRNRSEVPCSGDYDYRETGW